jgi:hypothetical protein
VQLKAHEDRKIRHYAHHLKADLGVVELASAWSHGDVFARLGLTFLPAAMSIFGNRGEAMEGFLRDLAKITPSYSSKYFFEPVENSFAQQQQVTRTRDYYRALISIGFIRGLYSALLRRSARSSSLHDSDHSHVCFTHPLPPF